MRKERNSCGFVKRGGTGIGGPYAGTFSSENTDNLQEDHEKPYC